MIICDTHCDTLYNLQTAPGQPLDVTMERLKAGGVSVQTMAMYVGPGRKGCDVEALMAGMLKHLENLKAAGWKQIDDPNEAVDGEVAIMLSMEGCEPFDLGLSVIEEYRHKGLRMAAVTWNHENTLAYPAMSGSKEGLKPYGVQAIKEMQRLGIAVDVSHLNEAGFYDIFNKTNMPPMASHSNCAAIVDHPRNLTDDQLRTMFKNGGYVGINFWPTILGPDPDLDTVVDHVDHMYQLGGEGKVGFGSDFDGIGKKPRGLDNPSDFPKLIEALRRRGFKEEDVKDVAGLGLLKYYQRIKV